MDKKRLKWGKPKLIVLIKAKPDERVLYACKDYSMLFSMEMVAARCNSVDVCAACSAMMGS